MTDEIKLPREFGSDVIPELGSKYPVLGTIDNHVDLSLRNSIHAQPTCGFTKPIIKGGNLGVSPLSHIDQGRGPVQDQSEGFRLLDWPLTR